MKDHTSNTKIDLWKALWQANKEPFSKLQEFEEKIGYSFKNIEHLCEALTHRSAINGTAITGLSRNERIEFLGDSILGFAISSFLWQTKPGLSEGELSKLRSSLVNEQVLAQIAKTVNLGDYVLLGKGELKNKARDRKSLLADALEAVIGAVYLDAGLERARALIAKLYEGIFLHESLASSFEDHKSKLQENLQKAFKETPSYEVLGSFGPDHAREFRVGVFLGEKKLGEARGLSKKQASQFAAKKALENLGSPLQIKKPLKESEHL